MALSLTPRSNPTDVRPSPFAAVTARARAATGAAPAQAEAQGSFSAHLTLTLYGADGRAREVEDAAWSLSGAQLAEDVAAVIEVQDAQGRQISVTLRKDGTYAAVEHTGSGIVRYDSRTGDAGAGAGTPQRGLAERAARIAGLAASSGTGVALAAGAQGALAAAAGSDGSTNDVTVTITDAHGVSRYAGGDHGVVSAWRSTSDVALETLTIDQGVQTDAVRRTDGSGATTIGGGAMGGTTFVVTHDRDGTEHVDVTSGGGQGLTTGAVAVSALDAFGERIAIGRDAQGQANVELTDAAGTSFTLSASLSGTSASLAVELAVGDETGTKRAELTEDATATSTTGSDAHATSSLVANAHDAKNPAGMKDGSLTLVIDANVASSKTERGGTVETRGTASLGVHAQASGTLDVAGATAAGVGDGYRDEKNRQRVVAGTSREANGGAVLDSAASHEILAVEVIALGDDLRTPAAPQNSLTKDDATISIAAFGHRTSALRHDDIERVKNHVRVVSHETIF